MLTIGGSATVTGNTIQDGSSNGGAGGIGNYGTLILNGRASVTGNSAPGSNGGGIATDIDAGPTTIGGQVIVSGNTASQGGGILNSGGSTLTLAGSASVSHNTASSPGGGIWNVGTLALGGRATVSFNTAPPGTDSGGGIYTYAGAVTSGVVAGFGGNVFGNKPDGTN